MQSEEAIKAAMTKLLEEKPYDEITIADIYRTANVSNKTLYRHFDGKRGIVRAIIRDHWVSPVLKAREFLPLDEIKSATAIMNERAYATVHKNLRLYRNLIEHYGREELGADIASALYELNSSVYEGYGFDPEEKEFAAWFFATSQIPMLFWWVMEHSDIPPQRMAEYHYRWSFAHWRERFGNLMNVSDLKRDERHESEPLATSID